MTPPADGHGDSDQSDDDLIGTGWSTEPGDALGPDEPGPAAFGGAVGFAPPDQFAGVVRGFSPTSESSSMTNQQTLVWRFRIDQFDQDGNLVGQIPVEMRGRSFTGILENGYQVGVAGGWKDGRVVSDEVTVYRDGVVVGIVRAEGMPPWPIVVSVLIALAFIAFVIWGVIHMRNIREQQPSISIPGQLGPASGAGTNPGADPAEPANGTIDPNPEPTNEVEPPVVETAPASCSGATNEGPYVTVSVGGTVRFENAGEEPMNLAFAEPEPPGFTAATVQPEGTYDVRFDEPGTFIYGCNYPTSTQSGKVTVESG